MRRMTMRVDLDSPESAAETIDLIEKDGYFLFGQASIRKSTKMFEGILLHELSMT